MYNIHAIGPANRGVAIVMDTPFAECRAVNCATAGSATVTWPDNTTSTFYFTQGTNPISIINVASSGATAATLVALY
jgi:hypothetical protein